MTDNLTEELARLSALYAKRPVGGKVRMSFTEQTDIRAAMCFDYMCDATLAFPDAIALANNLQAENERLKALLVATRGIFKEAVDCVDNCCDCLGCSSDETLRPRVSDALAKLHAAGIGGE